MSFARSRSKQRDLRPDFSPWRSPRQVVSRSTCMDRGTFALSNLASHSNSVWGWTTNQTVVSVDPENKDFLLEASSFPNLSKETGSSKTPWILLLSP